MTFAAPRGLSLYWDARGWPEGIAYVKQTSGGEAERWSVGITCSESEARAAIEPLLSAPCELTFVPCERSRGELRELLPEVIADYRLDLACGDIHIVQDSIWVYATSVPGLHELYVAAAKAKYGGAVRIMPKNGPREENYTLDANGNRVPSGEDTFTFEIFLLCAAALSAAAVVLGIVFRRRIRAAIKPKWLRALLPAAFVLLIWGAEVLTAAITKPSAESCCAKWCEPYEGETHVVSLGRTSGLEYSAAPSEATPEMLLARADEKLLALCEPEPVTGRDTVREGDIITLDWVTMQQGRIINVRSDVDFIADKADGFTSLLIGAKLNELEKYSCSYGGEAYEVEATVTALKGFVSPAMTDEFVAAHTSYETAEAFKSAAAAEYEIELAERARDENAAALLDEIARGSVVFMNSSELYASYDALEKQSAEEGGAIYNEVVTLIKRDAVSAAIVDKYGLTADDEEATRENLCEWLLGRNKAK